MGLFTKESLEQLRQKIDLAEVIGSHVSLKRAGSAYKALCPFHEEKTPSFVIQKGDSHYHCFGCGAHGDAIAFLMSHLRMGFSDAVESLAERFGVPLEKEEASNERKGPSKGQIKEILEKACRFYHFSLLYSEEGVQPLEYLYRRGIGLAFIQRFEVGYAPEQPGVFQEVMRQMGAEDEVLHQAGLILMTESGRKRDFFAERITFPVRDALGSVIGFSARKFREETFGGKYINTPETPLFKKSHVLFGLSYCRRKIAKERKAIVVEGQIDALRLIDAGFDFTVAGQGTAFGEGHVKELLNLGVRRVFLALDGDSAGQEAAYKIGDLFQSKGVEVSIVPLPEGKDPDSLLRTQGAEAFGKLLEETETYLAFCIRHLSKSVDANTPSGKNELARTLSARIDYWDQPVMVHESKRQLARLLEIPEAMIGVEAGRFSPLRKNEPALFQQVDPDLVLETDLLRWMVVMGPLIPKIIDLVRLNIRPQHLRTPICARLYQLYLQAMDKREPCDLLALAEGLENETDQTALAMILERKINPQKAEEGAIETIRAILTRQWMEEREAVKSKILSGSPTEDEALELAREFDRIKKTPPEVQRCI